MLADRFPRLRIDDVLRGHVGQRVKACALVDGDRRTTYGELAVEVDAMARAMVACGVEHGDRVAMLAPPCADFWTCFLASASIGAIWVGLNPRYMVRDTAYVVEHAQPRLILAVSPLEGRQHAAELRAVAPAATTVVTIGDDAAPGLLSLEAFLHAGKSVTAAQLQARRDRVTPADIAALTYTSGTTGAPKGAMLSQGSITACAAVSQAWMGDALDSVVMGAPINHVGALCNLCMNVFFHGGKIVFLRRVHIPTFLDLGEREATTLLPLGHAVFGMLLDTPSFALERMRSGRLLIHGGSKTTESLLSRFEPLPARIASVYGQTETCGIVLRTAPDASLEAHANTLGTPVQGVETRIVDPQRGLPCAAGEVGELQVRCNFLFSGYFANSEATAEAFTSDGFLRTGDLCRQRSDGNFELVDRIKLMFKSGGYNVYPSEVEQAIGEHPAVRGAVVLPMPDSRWSEVGFAFVAHGSAEAPTEEALRSFLHDRIANYKIPKRFCVMPSLPTLPTLKFDRQALATRMHQMLQSEADTRGAGS